MSETKTYTGGCHCGAVRFEVDADLSQGVMECNCSHCVRKGFLLSFVPAQDFKLLSGEEALTDYRFNTGKVEHQFCKICGTQAFAGGAMPDGSQVKSINVRCLDEVEPENLVAAKIDGKSM